MSEPWKYQTLKSFDKSIRKLKVSNEELLSSSLKRFIEGFNNLYQNDRNKLLYRSPRNKFEIWCVGIGNPEANKGKSGGFRVVFFLVLETRAACMYSIEHRNSRGFKGEGKKKKQDALNDLQDLIKELVEAYEKE